MNERLVGYLLNLLDDAERASVEDMLRADPELRAELQKIKRSLAPLDYDAEPPAVPEGLADRTLETVESLIDNIDYLPTAPDARSEATEGGSRWKRSDILVAIAVMVLMAVVSIPAMFRLRGPESASAVLECKNNLREFHAALENYRMVRGSYPDLSAQAPRNVAGVVIPLLIDAGALSPNVNVQCPGNGPASMCTITLAALRSMTDDEFARTSPILSKAYSYTLGFRDDAGHVHSNPADVSSIPSNLTPIMADRAPTDGVIANSVNHGGAGQNVLFLDGSVRFARTRTVGFQGDDIFCNQNDQVAAGLRPTDSVLGYSAARP